MFTHANFSRSGKIVHGFSTRLDGASRRLDLGAGASSEDWAAAVAAVGAPDMAVAIISQVHGAGVLWATGPGLVGEADAVLSREVGLLLAVRTADCVPILVAGEGVVGAIHAGWRGLAAGVIPAALAELDSFGALSAVVGPSICMDCYEVDEPVVEGISRWIPESSFVRRGSGRPHVDPGAAAVAQLKASGLTDITRVEVCTSCDPRLWSHRQSGAAAGRQAGLVGRLC